MPGLLAPREDIEITLADQRPPCKPPDSPHCYASNFKVPKSHREAMRGEHAYFWEDSTGREFHGLLDAGTSESVEQPVDNFIHVKWVFDWKTDGYGWPPKLRRDF